jgi:hypothetical protein
MGDAVTRVRLDGRSALPPSHTEYLLCCDADLLDRGLVLTNEMRVEVWAHNDVADRIRQRDRWLAYCARQNERKRRERAARRAQTSTSATASPSSQKPRSRTDTPTKVRSVG